MEVQTKTPFPWSSKGQNLYFIPLKWSSDLTFEKKHVNLLSFIFNDISQPLIL